MLHNTQSSQVEKHSSLSWSFVSFWIICDRMICREQGTCDLVAAKGQAWMLLPWRERHYQSLSLIVMLLRQELFTLWCSIEDPYAPHPLFQPSFIPIWDNCHNSHPRSLCSATYTTLWMQFYANQHNLFHWFNYFHMFECTLPTSLDVSVALFFFLKFSFHWFVSPICLIPPPQEREVQK